MKKTLKTLIITITVILGLSMTASASDTAQVPTEAEAYASIMALQSQYPTGMTWTNDTKNQWGAGCSAFVGLLQNAAYGNELTRYTHNNPETLHIGDNIRMGTHGVVVIGFSNDNIIVAEGNINGQVMWGRTISRDTLRNETILIGTYYVSEDTIAWDNARAAYRDEWMNSPTITVTLSMENGARRLIIYKGPELITDTTVIRAEYTNDFTKFSYIDNGSSLTVTFNGDTQTVNIGETKVIGDITADASVPVQPAVTSTPTETTVTNTETTTNTEVASTGFTIISSPEYFRNCGIFLDGKSITAYKATRDHGMEFTTNADKSITVTYKGQTYYVAPGGRITINK